MLSVADETFLDVCVERGYIDDKARRRIALLQDKHFKSSRYRNAIDIALQEKAVTPTQASKVWRDQAVLRRYLEEDRVFGDIVFRVGILDRDEMRTFYVEQQDNIDFGLYVRLGDMMLAENAITVKQYASLMEHALSTVRQRVEQILRETGTLKDGKKIMGRLTKVFRREY